MARIQDAIAVIVAVVLPVLYWHADRILLPRLIEWLKESEEEDDA